MSLLGKVGKVFKKAAKIVTTVNPALGGGFSKINAMQGQALMNFMPGASLPVPSLSSGNPLATMLGGLGTKLGVPAGLGTAVASSFLPQLPTLDEARTYAAWKLAPDSVLQNLKLDQFGNPVKKHRRMNPLNARAAKRAIRRIKAVRKITAGIERALPKSKARTYAHFGHHHHRR